MSQMHQDVEVESSRLGVLIVGAGPTGLTLGVELARRGIAFRLIDREPTRPITSRALGTQQRTVEVFTLMGIPVSALVPSLPALGIEVLDGERTLAQIANFGPAARGPLVMAESATERVLEQRLTLLGGRIELGTELVGYRIERGGVVARLRDASGETDVLLRYLVGADGAQSTVRRLAGIGFTGAAYPERFLLADLELDWARPHDRVLIWVGEDGLLACLPLPEERRWRLIVTLPADDMLAPNAGEQDKDSEAALAERALQELRRSGAPVRMVGAPVWASAFRIQRRLADRYRDGPVFLAGDAAHVHSPVGAQGMNTGIQDAFNLGWKLALAVREQAAPGLLDTYETERREVARDVLRGTDVATRLLLAQHPAARLVRERAIPLLSKLTPVRQRLVQTVAEIDIAYQHSPLSVNAPGSGGSRVFTDRLGLRAGERVPDAALLTAPQGNPVSLFDLISRGWLLLLFPGEGKAPERIAALEALAGEMRDIVGGMVQLYLVTEVALDREATVPRLLDPVGEVNRMFGAAAGLVAMVRPDGYLGYRGRPEQQLELASYLARVYAMRLRGLDPLISDERGRTDT